MVIVKILGGLGNQLFQYALYRNLQEMGKEVYLDISVLDTDEYRKKNNITLFPKINIKQTDKETCKRLSDSSNQIISRIRRKIFGKRSTYFSEDYNLHFQEEVLSKDNIYLVGCWQSELYFYQIREKLLEELIFPKDIGSENEKLLLDMGDKSASIHIRRGDYLQGRAKQLYGGICTDKYYDNAVSYLRNKYGNIHFYIFTNDVDWARQKYKDKDMTIVDWNQGSNDYLDMYLMTKCHYNIIANSSFSWWGAWLNNHQDKEVISPQIWFNPQYHEAPHIICKDWTKIEG